jgi:hypothetical protein
MFVVAPISREHRPATDETPEGFVTTYPVVFEDVSQGYAHPPVASRPDRDEAQRIADALNAALS